MYLPPTTVDHTEFPKAQAEDFWLAVRLAEENWSRHFPFLQYHALNQAPTPDTAGDYVVGAAGTTNVDLIYGETVDEAMAAAWTQPHNDDAVSAAVSDVEVFADAVLLPIRAAREAQEKELKRWGFDEVRDLLATIPLSLLDKHAITVQQGDKVVWDADEYTVLQYTRDGYWGSSNARLFMVCNLEHRREGS
jgi:hypothetical protein